MRKTVLISVLAILASPVAAWAQQQQPDDLVCALDPGCTKQVTTPPVIGAEGRHTRGILKTGGAVVAPQLKNSVNMAVNFQYNSSELETDALITLQTLGKTLSDPKLTAYKFRIAGHTDSRGNPGYNQALSERRAKMVREYLISHYGIAPARLTAVGYGSKQPLFTDDPENGANRRVQIVNATVNPSE